MVSKQGNTPPSVAAHRGLSSVRIEVTHPEKLLFVVFEQNQAIGSNPCSAMTQCGHILGRRRECLCPVVDHDEVVAGTLVFIESLPHTFKGEFTAANMVIFTKKPFCFRKNSGYL